MYTEDAILFWRIISPNVLGVSIRPAFGIGNVTMKNGRIRLCAWTVVISLQMR